MKDIGEVKKLFEEEVSEVRDGIVEIKSNRFDFAEGFSSLKVFCDLLNEKYSIKLGAKGVDTLAEKYAEEKKYKFKCFPDNWGQFGSAAGPIRNKKMVR